MSGLTVPAKNSVQRNVARWQPGQSGNPKGRPKSQHDLPALCREYTAEAVLRLVQIMRAEDDARALAAVQQLLDRGWGRPITPVVTNEQPESLSLLHLIAARRVAEALEHMAQTANDSAVPGSDPKVIDYSVPALE